MRRHRLRWAAARVKRLWVYQVRDGRWAVHSTRHALYQPLELLGDLLPGRTPVWLVRLVGAVDAPLLRALCPGKGCRGRSP